MPTYRRPSKTHMAMRHEVAAAKAFMPRHQTRLGEMFRLYRTARGVSLRSVAPTIGISSATLARIETGQAFDADTLWKLWAWMLAADTRD